MFHTSCKSFAANRSAILAHISFITFLASVMGMPRISQATANQPLWCASASLSTTESIICEDQTLASSDLLLTQLYKDLMSYRGKEGHEGMWPGEVISNQRDWLQQRNRATKKHQLLALYTSRIQRLSELLQIRLNN